MFLTAPGRSDGSKRWALWPNRGQWGFSHGFYTWVLRCSPPHSEGFGPTSVNSFKYACIFFLMISYFNNFFFLLLILERGREGEREGKKCQSERKTLISALLHTPLLGTKPATQACALTRNRTHNFAVCRTTPNQLSHTVQGLTTILINLVNYLISVSYIGTTG